MATCGYLCPACEGRGFTETGEPCDWCSPLLPAKSGPTPEDLEDWIKKVHDAPCCGDLGVKEDFKE
ncbi:MAG TPA: hypothetical protein VL947_04965 [Cytophagales bacterium]|nr:hypothetical protein [Cytophagales bacterium]